MEAHGEEEPATSAWGGGSDFFAEVDEEEEEERVRERMGAAGLGWDEAEGGAAREEEEEAAAGVDREEETGAVDLFVFAVDAVPATGFVTEEGCGGLTTMVRGGEGGRRVAVVGSGRGGSAARRA